MNRGAAKRHFKTRNRRLGTVAGGTLAGAGVGGAVGGGKGAAIGAAAGAGSSYIYTKKSRSYRRRRY
jgi:outer membrane lipoprotein SlyB